MPWFAASAIMYVRFKSGTQESYPVRENVLLVEADSAVEAHRPAMELAMREEGDAEGSFRWEDRPAVWVFAGIRKIVTVTHEQEEQLGHGDEITYSQFRVSSEADLKRLVAGEEVPVQYEE